MVKQAWQGRNLLGEAPVWDPRAQCLFWCDILTAELYRLDPKTGDCKSWPLDAPACALALHEKGGLIGTNHHQFIHIDTATMAVTKLTDPLFSDELMFNDGHCAPDGSFIAGAKHAEETQGLAPLYRLDPETNEVTILAEGYTVANGIDFSPDGQFLYVADSPKQVIYRYPFDDENAALGEASVFVTLGPDEGLADSFTIDRDGCLWNAQFAAHRVQQYSPEGQPLETVPLPVSFPTVCCLGGEVFKTLFITTATRDLSEQGLIDEPWSGSVLATEVRIPAQAPRYFTGV